MEVMLHPSLNQGSTTKRARPSSLSRGGGFSIFRMLKQVSGGVLGEETSSTYLKRVRLRCFLRLRLCRPTCLSILYSVVNRRRGAP